MIPLPPLTVTSGADKYPDPVLVIVIVSTDALSKVAIVALSACDSAVTVTVASFAGVAPPN